MGTPETRGVGWSILLLPGRDCRPCMFHSCDIIETLYAIRTPHQRSLLQACWLLYVPPGLTFRNSIFCPHYV